MSKNLTLAKHFELLTSLVKIQGFPDPRSSLSPLPSLFPAQPESRLSATPVQEKSRAPPVQEDWEEEPRSVIGTVAVIASEGKDCFISYFLKKK